MILARRMLNRLVGAGPWRIAAVDEIARQRSDEARHGVHRPEGFAGIIRREEDAGFAYGPRRALLGQSEQGELLTEGPRYRAGGVAGAEPKLLWALSDAGIAGRDGVVYCPHLRAAARETVRCWTRPSIHHPLLGAVRFPKPQFLGGTSLSLATLDAEGFYHFLLESVPRLWLARELLASVDHVLVSGERQAGHEAWLALAGVPAEKTIWLNPHAHFRCAQLLFANRPFREQQPTPWLCHALGRLFPKAASPRADRWLWISRADAKKRHIAWEDEFLRRLPRFEKILLTSLPPAEQVDLFARAAVVAGPHGAGFANLAFTRPGIRFIELFPNERLQPVFGRLAQIASGRVAWATVDFSRPTELDRLVAAFSAFLAE